MFAIRIEGLRFYVDQLGFDLAFDAKLQTGGRWVAVAPPDGSARAHAGGARARLEGIRAHRTLNTGLFLLPKMLPPSTPNGAGVEFSLTTRRA